MTVTAILIPSSMISSTFSASIFAMISVIFIKSVGLRISVTLEFCKAEIDCKSESSILSEKISKKLNSSEIKVGFEEGLPNRIDYLVPTFLSIKYSLVTR